MTAPLTKVRAVYRPRSTCGTSRSGPGVRRRRRACSRRRAWRDGVRALDVGLEAEWPHRRRGEHRRFGVPLVLQADLPGWVVVRAPFRDPLADEPDADGRDRGQNRGIRLPGAGSFEPLHETCGIRIGIDGAVRVPVHRRPEGVEKPVPGLPGSADRPGSRRGPSTWSSGWRCSRTSRSAAREVSRCVRQRCGSPSGRFTV